MALTLNWIYGLLAIASVFITAGMAKLFIEYKRETARMVSPTADEKYLAVLWYGGLHGLGGSIFWIIRSWDAVVNHRTSVSSAPWLILLALVLYLAGKAGLVYASSLNGKPNVWRGFLVFAVLWSAVVWWSLLLEAV